MKQNNDLMDSITKNTAYADRLSELIKTVVCGYYDLPIGIFKSKSRLRNVIKAKQTTVWFIRKLLPNVSLIFIGKHTGYDHATVIHCLKQINNLLETDKSTQLDIKEIELIMQVKESVFILDDSIADSYYYINLDKCISIRQPDGKSIVLGGYTIEEAKEMLDKLTDNFIDSKVHENTKLFILEKKENNEEN